MHGSATLDCDAVPASLADAAVTPDDPAYGQLTSTYFRGGAPGIVLLPRSVAQVVAAVDFAGRHLHVPLGIRSGGHGLSGRSTNRGGIAQPVPRQLQRRSRRHDVARRPAAAVPG